MYIIFFFSFDISIEGISPGNNKESFDEIKYLLEFTGIISIFSEFLSSGFFK